MFACLSTLKPHHTLKGRKAISYPFLLLLALPLTHAAQPQLGDAPASMRRINAYFANVPEFDYPCGLLLLKHEPGFEEALSPEDLQTYRQLTALDGPYAVALAASQASREQLRGAYMKRLQEAFDGYLLLSEWSDTESTGLVDQAQRHVLDEVGRNHQQQYHAFIAQAYQAYRDDEAVRQAAKNYYQLVTKAFGALEPRDQEKYLDGFFDRLDCLRKARKETYLELMNATIKVEEGFARHLSEVSGPGSKAVIAPLGIDIINHQMKRSALQLQYSWLVAEFSVQVSIYRDLLWIHDQTLRNQVLEPLMAEAAMEHPDLLPDSALPPDRKRQRAREDIARVRARIGYITLLEDEARVEALYAVNTSPMARLGTQWDDIKKKAATSTELIEWVKAGGLENFDTRSKISALMAVGMFKQVTGDAMDRMIMTPMRDYAISGMQATGLFDKGSWKTSTADDLQKYQDAVTHLGLRIKFLEGWSRKLDYDEGMKYVRLLRHSGSTGERVAGGMFDDLLANHDFSGRTRGGIAAILAPLCEDPVDLRAVWYGSCRTKLRSRILDGRNRLAKARGVEEVTDVNALIAHADLQLGLWGPVDMWSDVFFEIPSILKNFVGGMAGDYTSQEAYLEGQVNQSSRLDLILTTCALPEFRHDPRRLVASHPGLFVDHLLLQRHLVDYAEATLQVDKANWQRVRHCIQSRERPRNEDGEATGELTAAGKLMLPALQRAREEALLDQTARVAFMKLAHFAYTGDYAAAAKQTEAWADLANQLREKRGLDTRHNVRGEVLEFKAKAAAQETVAVYEGLLNEAITSIITTRLTSGIQEYLLGQLKGQQWLDNYLVASAPKDTFLSHSLKTLFPAHKVFSREGLWDMLEDTALTVGSQQASYQLAQWANDRSGVPGAYDAAGFQAVVDQAVSLSWDTFKTVGPAAFDVAVNKVVAVGVGDATVKTLREEAESAHAFVSERMSKAVEESRKYLEELNWDNLTADQRRELRDTVLDDRLNSPLKTVGVQQALAKQRRAQEAYEEEYQLQQQRRATAENVLAKFGYFQRLKQAGLASLDRMGAEADLSTARPVAEVLAQGGSWERLLFGDHSIQDLERISQPDTLGTLNEHLLTRTVDINLLRRAFSASLADARARDDQDDQKRVKDALARIDEKRIRVINEGLEEFLATATYTMQEYENGPELTKSWRDEVELVIQGGAAKGNPEYQGLLADIDFTLMLREDSTADQTELKKAILGYFDQKGYPLTDEDVVSSMDSEAFVQKLGRFDSSKAGMSDIIKDLLEKGRDPTRFYSEGGSIWFINNAAYSGKVLWKGNGKQVEWQPMPKEFGHDLATDMIRYLGFLGDPAYSSKNVGDKDKPYEYRRGKLESALVKGKYFLRLIDAYVIGHEQGNALYNARMRRKPADGTGDEASYHLQIYRDVEKLVETQDAKDLRNVLTKDDLDMVRRLAEMKMKGKFDTPMAVIEGEGVKGEKALREAQETLEWMRKTGPRLIARLADDFHQGIEARTNSSEEGTRNEAFGSVMRMALVARNIMVLDDPGSVPWLVSKMGDNGPLTMEEHAVLIRQRLEDAQQGTHPTAEVENVLHTSYENEEDDAVRMQRATEAVEQGTLKKIAPEEVAVFQYEKVFQPWLDYMLWADRRTP